MPVAAPLVDPLDPIERIVTARYPVMPEEQALQEDSQVQVSFDPKSSDTEESNEALQALSGRPERRKLREGADPHDLLSSIPPELAALGISDIATIPPPRPVLWGQNKDIEDGSKLNTKFISTEKEIMDGFDDIPMVSINFASSSSQTATVVGADGILSEKFDDDDFSITHGIDDGCGDDRDDDSLLVDCDDESDPLLSMDPFADMAPHRPKKKPE
jgi:hypothetical protein